VAPHIAALLGWTVADIDGEIVARAGVSVAELFRTRGESAFRELEARLTAELSSLSGVVLAPGGGWAAQPGSLEGLPEGTCVVWLRVSPEEALKRLHDSPQARPLLAGPDPLTRLRELERQRTQRYARADLVVDVDDRPPAEIAEEISEWLRRNTS
jgi:shikimate kinase